jgi:PIN domain nuclease of toxin-antitoxin system
MNILVDTCDFLWLAGEPSRLSSVSREALADPRNNIFLSAISYQEIAIKYQLRKITLPLPPEHFLPESCRRLLITPLPLFSEAVLLLSTLSPHHRAPFDRALVCQAIFHRLIFVSSDPIIRLYPVTLL